MDYKAKAWQNYKDTRLQEFTGANIRLYSCSTPFYRTRIILVLIQYLAQKSKQAFFAAGYNVKRLVRQKNSNLERKVLSPLLKTKNPEWRNQSRNSNKTSAKSPIHTKGQELKNGNEVFYKVQYQEEMLCDFWLSQFLCDKSYDESTYPIHLPSNGQAL